MALFNLLDSVPKAVRDVAARRADKEYNRAVASQFGRAYFDGPREQGYGGYVYDGRWKPVARKLIARYGLGPGQRVLDIGCAKGFLVKDLAEALPGLVVIGLDISNYALANAVEGIGGRLVRGRCDRLPFADGTFDLALAINTVHNLPPGGCERAIREMARVAPKAGFIQVDAYRDESERALFEDWMLTAQTYLRPEDWVAMFARAGYDHDYYWTILLPDGSTA